MRSRPEPPPRPYTKGILGDPIDLDGDAPRRPRTPKVAATIGLEVTHRASGVIGRVLECTPQVVVLRDDGGRDRRLRNGDGAFTVDGKPVTLVTARREAPASRGPTASGSIAAPEAPARVARASRLLVEGIHDAELVEKVWGDDLRHEGVVVERLDGVDDLGEVVRRFAPRPGRRLGVLVDHLVDGSKESRIAAAVDHPDVAVRGHRFVDVWAACAPSLMGLDAWPDIPRGTPWKDGICAAVGIDDPAMLWRTLLGRVESYKDLDPSLVGAVEELIDFVASPL